MYSDQRWILFCFALLAARGMPGAAFLPPLDGSFSGDLFPLGQSKIGIHWTATSIAAASGGLKVELALAGPGLKAAAHADLGENRAGRWTLYSAEIDTAQWLDLVATRFFPDSIGLHAGGVISAVGQGTWDDSTYHGAITFNLTAASLSDSAGTWSLSDLSGEMVCPALPAWTTADAQHLRFGQLKVGDFLLENGVVDYQIVSSGQLQVERIGVKALEGTVECAGFVLGSTGAPIEAVVRARGVDLGALQKYLPKAVAEVHGRIDAELRVRWSAAAGFEFGPGSLKLQANADASIRLAPAPGFLSSQVPARIQLAPAWMGRMGRAFSQIFPAHRTLEAIEMGEQALMVESIEAEMHPAALDQEATAILRVVAHPAQTDAVKKVRLNIKVTGPLADVLRYGLDDRVAFGR